MGISSLSALNVSVAWKLVPAKLHQQGRQRKPRHVLPEHHEVRRRHPHVNVVLPGGTKVPRVWLAHDEGAHCVGTSGDEHYGGRTRAELFGVN